MRIDYTDESLMDLPNAVDPVMDASLYCRFTIAFWAVVDQSDACSGDWVAVWNPPSVWHLCSAMPWARRQSPRLDIPSGCCPRCLAERRGEFGRERIDPLGTLPHGPGLGARLG